VDHVDKDGFLECLVEEQANFCSLFSNARRVQILWTLADRELSVGAIALNTFEQGIDGIIVMDSGTDCPYKGAAERTAQIINQTYQAMKRRGIDARRLRLAAICTVCTKPFVKEANLMNELLEGIGFVKDEIAANVGAPGKESFIMQPSASRHLE
jgi:coenzyme F420-reducing hydrogenase delta subunit